jgi:hypothetical protein
LKPICISEVGIAVAALALAKCGSAASLVPVIILVIGAMERARASLSGRGRPGGGRRLRTTGQGANRK